MPETASSVLSQLLRDRARVDEELARRQQLVTILFVDIVGSTRFYDRYGDVAGLAMVQKFLDKLLPVVTQHDGVVVKTIGDAILARFGEAEAGVRCALDMQWSMMEQNIGHIETDQIHIRIALNCGLGLIMTKDVFGDVVNVCSRIESAAHSDEILISPSVYDQICGHEDIAVRKRAEAVPLKGKAEKLELYEVVWRFGDEITPAPPRPSDEQIALAALPSEAPPAVTPGAPRPIPETTAEVLPAGARLSERYRIVSLLGHGGMGEVYRAEDMELGQEVALKFVTSPPADHPALLQRFHSEVRTARQVSHPNVCRVYDIAEWQGRRFITMEYVDGEDLQTLLRRIGHLPSDKALELAHQICAGVAAAHDVGVLHRDLKTSNVMIDGRGRARITDFGLAIHLEEGLHRPVSLAGTPAFMAPEQLLGQAATVRTDIYSLGLVLYHMFTGTVPFPPEPAPGMLRRWRNRSCTPVSQYVPGIDPAIEEAIGRCLEEDAHLRPASVHELIALLPHAAAAATISAGKQGESTRDKSGSQRPPLSTQSHHSSAAIVLAEARRHKGIVISAALAVLVLAGVLGVVLYNLTVADRAGAGEQMSITRVTQGSSTVEAALSPDGQYIVHTERDGENQSLNVRHVATGSDVVILAPELASIYGLAYAPDGNYIYFVRSSQANQNYSDLMQIPVLGGTPRTLLRDIDTGVSFSPDGSQIAFVRGVPANHVIHVVVARADGSNAHVLAQIPASTFFDNMYAPAWSPDGKTIAVSTWATAPAARATLSIVSATDGSHHDVYSSPTPIGQPQWMGDGNRLLVAIQEATQDRRGQIWEIAARDGRARRLTNDLTDYDLRSLSLARSTRALTAIENTVVSNLWVTPPYDASRVQQATFGGPAVFVVSWTPSGGIVYQNAAGEIVLSDATGSAHKVLAPVATANSWPSACGAGGSIVYSSLRGDKYNVWRVDINGSNPFQLTDESMAARPQCSPDGTWLVYVRGDSTAWRMPIEGAPPVQVAARLSRRKIAISPDGKFLAYIGMPPDPSRPNQLTIIPATGGAPVQTIDMPLGADEVAWAPNGNALDYLLTRRGVSNIWRQPLTGGPARQITAFDSGLIFHFDWSRDGRTLALARGYVGSDIVLIRGLR